ncbi:hypothetical protein FOC4_g10002392 [Fusarium odoratissimum]|uniref:Uncharacterized protein n=3 Tax=Fusarium oxysporum species complex TaxID=171631 RepID=N1SBY3_FUSC4|nr:hypothetical protein FOC4_g10002392 [Fusarium odoratissimum]TXB97666.1 hypothetical protein FocTR4_00010949 [Fusarium oxysporum f. sp. cubense]
MQLSTLCCGLALLQGALASPIAEPAAQVEIQDINLSGPNFGDFPWPRMPALRCKFFFNASNNVSNLMYT